ncbi:MAG: molybdenum cofactor guanylyltransferase [Leptolyngbyaceae cyanobacterium RU_5_1]|nr:molybdenum cofactor guanylyltransferase [Leptolyngbyaceae cyanobacterium RU_5_1]
MAISLAAIVLAGGQSSRMGRDKALISIQGVPLLQRTCEVALQCTAAVYVVTSRTEQYRAVVPDGCCLVQEHPLPGEMLPHGPLVGFAQGLAHTHTEWVLLLACDLPLLRADVLRSWMWKLDQAGSEIALLPKTESGWEPLCGFYRASCLPSLSDFIDQGGRSLQRWLSQVNVNAIAFSSSPDEHSRDRDMLFNCNTPEDLRLLL